MDYLYVVSVALHVLFAVFAVGAVGVVDFLHLWSLRHKKIEKNLLTIYPLLSKYIIFSLIGIYISGLALVLQNSQLLYSSLFQAKMILVILVTINGFILHHTVLPKIVSESKTKKYSKKVLFMSCFTGVFSIVTWIFILILSLTKQINYHPNEFLIGYILSLIVGFILAYSLEKKIHNYT